MGAPVNPLLIAGDARLTDVLGPLDHHPDLPLVIEYDGRRTQAGYHVTEVKAGSFITLDCGGNPDRWSETILQVEDLPLEPDQVAMTVGKFGAILRKVAEKVDLAADARLTVEVGPPGLAMQVFDIASVEIRNDAAFIRLAPRAAICKPRHRAAQMANQACCGGASVASACCAS